MFEQNFQSNTVVQSCKLRIGYILHWEELQVNVPHGGVDDGAVRHSLGALGLGGGHDLLLGWLFVEDVPVRIGTFGIFWFPLSELCHTKTRKHGLHHNLVRKMYM